MECSWVGGCEGNNKGRTDEGSFPWFQHTKRDGGLEPDTARQLDCSHTDCRNEHMWRYIWIQRAHAAPIWHQDCDHYAFMSILQCLPDARRTTYRACHNDRRQVPGGGAAG